MLVLYTEISEFETDFKEGLSYGVNGTHVGGYCLDSYCTQLIRFII